MSTKRRIPESRVRILFPYMARWHSANRSRYTHLLTEIGKKGHPVIILQPPSRRSDEIGWHDIPSVQDVNIEVRTVDIPSWLWNLSVPGDKLVKKALFTLWSTPLVRGMMKRGEADILLLYNLPQYLYMMRTQSPVVFDYADAYIAMFRDEISAGTRSPLVLVARKVLDRVLSRAQAVTSVSEPLHSSFSHSSKTLLPNGADVRSSHPPRERPFRSSRRTIGFVGAFEYFIRLDLMLDLAERMPDDDILLIGGGRRYLEVEADIRRRGLTNVRLTGALPHPEAMALIDTMDVCLNLFAAGEVSDAASPIKLFEYLSRGKPVISTRVREVMRLDEDGRIIYFADTVDEMMSCIESMHHASADRRKRILDGQRLVRKDHTWEVIARSFIAVCRDVLDRRRANVPQVNDFSERVTA